MDFFWREEVIWLRSGVFFIIIIIASLFFSLYKNQPRKKIKKKISGTEAYLTIKYGNILDSGGHIAVTSSNFFNIDLKIISPSSLLAQIINRYCTEKNPEEINKDISKSIHNVQPERIEASRGKQDSYPIGTIANFTLPSGKKVFLMAITKITEKNGEESFESNISHVHTTINKLWDKIEIELDNEPLHIVPFGTGISRAFNRNAESILYIIQSFIDRAKKKRPCSELIIHLRHDDINLGDYIELKKIVNFLA